MQILFEHYSQSFEDTVDIQTQGIQLVFQLYLYIHLVLFLYIENFFAHLKKIKTDYLDNILLAHQEYLQFHFLNHQDLFLQI